MQDKHFLVEDQKIEFSIMKFSLIVYSNNYGWHLRVNYESVRIMILVNKESKMIRIIVVTN